jgi:hypothetical protein
VEGSNEPLKRTPALDQVDDQDDDRNDEQNVDEAAQGVGAHEPEQPQNEQNDEDGPEHDVFIFRLMVGLLLLRAASIACAYRRLNSRNRGFLERGALCIITNKVLASGC